MSLETHLENLRAKPEHIKKRYAFFGALGITAVIFAFWISSFGSVGVLPKSPLTAAVAKAPTPSENLIAGVGGFFSDIKELIFGAKKVEYKAVQVSAGKR